MKSYKVKIVIFSFLLLAGCSDFLDLKPISNSSIAGFYNSQNDFENAIIGAYSSLRAGGTFNDDVQLVGDLRSDNTEMGTTASDRFNYNDMARFQMNVDNKISPSIWDGNYKGITRVNEILERIDGLKEAPESFRDLIEGEARFLRAVFYFNLVRVFGDVPLVSQVLKTIEEGYEIGRTDRKEVYDLIVDDLEIASAKLPLKPVQTGRATSGAAKSLLGKVYLTIHENEKAASVLREVIQSNEYSLLSDYEDLWKVDNKNNNEIIFAVQFERASSNGTGSRFLERYSPYLYPHLGYYSTAGGYNIPTENLIEAFEPDDLRKDASINESYIDPDGNEVTGLQGRFQNKFTDVPIQGQGSNDNFPVIRYADVLLSYAEALNEIGFESGGEAFDYLNLIRSRAGLPDLSVNSKEEFREAVLHERRVEFAFEGHRWFDLIRMGKAIEIIKENKGIDINENKFVLPIPQEQIDINPEKIKQNPGY